MMNRTKLPSKARALVAVIAATLCFAAAFLTGCATPDRTVETPLTPPESTPKVHSVAITYNDKTVDGQLTVDLSIGSVGLDATVSKDDGANGTLDFDSSDKSVATVSQTGTVTLVAAGSAVITATYGDASCGIVLTVKDGNAGIGAGNSYSVTVEGGTADFTAATAGEIVTLTPAMPEHKEFVKWIFTDSETAIDWISGSMFKMPAGNVTVRAEYADTMYTLSLVGATVTADGGDEVQEGTVIGYDGETESPETAIIEYRYAYNARIDFSAVAPAAGKIFVGWDKNSVNNRIEGEVDYTGFVMPDEKTTIWANFSDIKSKELLTGELGIDIYTASPIASSAPGADPDLEGFSGFTFVIPAGTNAAEDYNECIKGSVLNTLSNPSQACRAIFKNRGDKDVTVELYASYNGNLATSGWVTVPSGSVVTKTFVASLGFWMPWWGFSVREKVGSGDDIPLDVVVAAADAYPKGDKTLATTAGTKFPAFAGNKFYDQLGSNGIQPNLGNNGWVYAGDYEHREYANVPYLYSGEFNNLPAYDPDDPYVTLYIRFVNQSAGHSYTYRFALSDMNVPVETIGDYPNRSMRRDENGKVIMKDGVAWTDITVSSHGQTELVALRVPRVQGRAYFISIMKLEYSTADNSKPSVSSGFPYYANNYSMILTYNNGIGFDGDFIEPANAGGNA